VAELVTAHAQAGAAEERAPLRFDFDVAERLQLFLHDGGAADEPDHRVRRAVDRADCVGEVHEAAG
jgi:hypothetical protein